MSSPSLRTIGTHAPTNGLMPRAMKLEQNVANSDCWYKENRESQANTDPTKPNESVFTLPKTILRGLRLES